MVHPVFQTLRNTADSVPSGYPDFRVDFFVLTAPQTAIIGAITTFLDIVLQES